MEYRVKKTNVRRVAAATAAVLGLAGASAQAQIPLDQYLKSVPLQYPRIIRQTEASARFHLFGDPSDPAYRDVAPKDGVDDARAAWLNRLAARFAPIMVRNTPQFPTDFRVFYDRASFPISVERWDIARAEFSLVDSVSIDMARLAANPCPASNASADLDDCRLKALVEKFGPNRLPIEPEATANAERETFTVMHFDLPGFNEKTWKENYYPPKGNKKRADLAGAARVFAHPFIAEVPSSEGGAPGYEFVIQYWFFYPANDGPNNHEGDWEHINVIVAPRSGVGRTFGAAELEALVAGRIELDGADPLVLKRIEYYLHHYVFPMDFASPNAYQPKATWNTEVEALAKARKVSRRIWDRVRERAWQDRAETRINTRPVVWIGGDAVGVQNVLEMPGLRDRDGHPSYPFSGYYKKIGQGSVGERVIQRFDHFEYFAGKPQPDEIEDYSTPERIALLPDWERVLEPVMTDAAARRAWAWLLLPLRFGYPASPSPGAGLVAHADMGNVSPIGPSYNNAWNRIGDSAGYETYDMVEESWATPLGAMDSFFPRAGFLNAPILYFMLKPPLDLAWRTLALPVRAVAGSRQPTFLPASAPAVRNVSLEVGPMLTDLNDDLAALFFSREQLPEIFVWSAILLPPNATDVKAKGRFGWATTPVYGITFHVSPRFSTESSIIKYRTSVGFDWVTPEGPPVEVRGDFEQFEYHGALRFNLKTGSFQPYVKYGHGITWYQLKNVRVNEYYLSQPTSPKFRPHGNWWDLGFNETILGGGVDWSNVRLGKTWLGFKASYTWIRHNIGFEKTADVEEFPAIAKAVAGTKYSLWRQQIRLLWTIGF